ncbi:hypothetical protein ACHAW5_005821 [Stephanodiscus triporus]|uniref:Uncharacterized protein n=1 Tax=Stephanodiscus triporus TaxID=2934178 RepID=A0ABD3PYD4_9STRA
MFYKTNTIDSLLAAFILTNRRQSLSRPGRPELQSISSTTSLNLSQGSSYPIGDTATPPPSSDKDWFEDGRESARQLRIELGLMSKYEDGDTAPPPPSSDKDFFEDGRESARQLKIEIGLMSKCDESSSGAGTKTNEINTCNDERSAELQDIEGKTMSQDVHFNIPSRKSHCMAICLVPPPSATKVWEKITAVRRECKDPGFFRWPPHANILYPFLEPVYNRDDDESKYDQQVKFKNEIAIHLSKAAMKCEPFNVTINSFGTFGGRQRGVLWAYPMSKYIQPRVDDEEPLFNLHRLLEQQFPICNEQRKTGAFHPHMTISHYTTNANALAAKVKIETGWESLSFRAHEFYLLERKGDDGQFKIAATITLGVDSEVEFHDPPIPFPAMPEVEEEWVNNERMAMKSRRKNGNKRTRSGRKGKELDALQNSRKEES